MFEVQGFVMLREREHIAMVRESPDGIRTPLTVPNHRAIKRSTLRAICAQAVIEREEFLDAYNRKAFLARC